MTKVLFKKDGKFLLPQQSALSPWGSDRLHGGPVLGLLVRGGDLAEPGGMHLCRLTVDMFAPVPNGPLEVQVESLRTGRRICLLRASVLSEGRAVTQGTLLYMKPAKGTYEHLDRTVPPGPDGLETRSLIGEHRRQKLPPGFHLEVQTRWPESSGAGKTIWFCAGMPLVEGEVTTHTQQAAVISDFNNAISSIDAYEAGRPGAHINVDTTLYLERPPQGEWFCLVADMQSDRETISVSQVIHYDRAGRFGRSIQGRLESKFG